MLCIEYHRLNSVFQIDVYPIPEVAKKLKCLGKAHVISTMKLLAGPVAIQYRHTTAFHSPFGFFQFYLDWREPLKHFKE